MLFTLSELFTMPIGAVLGISGYLEPLNATRGGQYDGHRTSH